MVDSDAIESDASRGAVPLLLAAVAVGAACFFRWAVLGLSSYPSVVWPGDDPGPDRLVSLSRGPTTAEIAVAAVLAIILAGLAVALTMRAIGSRGAGLAALSVAATGIVVVLVERAAIASAASRTAVVYLSASPHVDGSLGPAPLLILAGALVALGGGLWLMLMRSAARGPRVVVALASLLLGLAGVGWIVSLIPTAADPMVHRYETTWTGYSLLMGGNLVGEACVSFHSCADVTVQGLTTSLSTGDLSGAVSWLHFVDGTAVSGRDNGFATSVAIASDTGSTDGDAPKIGLAQASRSGECLLMTVSNVYPAPTFVNGFGATNASSCTGIDALAQASAPTQREGGWTELSGENGHVWPSLFFGRRGGGTVAFTGA
jgi:hypothetical protein